MSYRIRIKIQKAIVLCYRIMKNLLINSVFPQQNPLADVPIKIHTLGSTIEKSWQFEGHIQIAKQLNLRLQNAIFCHNYYHNRNMLRLYSVLGFRMAEIKANRAMLQTSPTKFNNKQIAKYMYVELAGTQTDQEITDMYLNHLGKNAHKYRKLSSMDFLGKNSELKILDYTKQELGKKKQLTTTVQNAIDQFFYFTIKVANDCLSPNVLYEKHVLWKELLSCLTSINQFYMLMTPRFFPCILYLNILQKSKRKVYFDREIVLTNYRLTLDYLVSLPSSSFQSSSVLKLFNQISQTNIHFHYHSESYKIINHFWRLVKDIWHLDINYQAMFLKSLSILSVYSESLLDRIQNLLLEKNQSRTDIQKVSYLLMLIKYRRFNSSNFRDPKYLKIIKSIIKDDHVLNKVFFFQTVTQFYMAGLWIPEYWLPFMKFMEKDGDNTIQIYKIYVLLRLFDIYKDEIPEQIIAASSPLKKIMEKHAYFQGEELIKDFLQKQGQSSRTLSCQIQIANSIRLLDIGSIRPEQQIQFFCVDILLNDRCVIEINGHTHYIVDMETGKKRYDIKTQFRSKTLMKLGYNVIDVELNEYSEGSFEVVSDIFNVVKNQKSFQNKKWIHLAKNLQLD